MDSACILRKTFVLRDGMFFGSNFTSSFMEIFVNCLQSPTHSWHSHERVDLAVMKLKVLRENNTCPHS